MLIGFAVGMPVSYGADVNVLSQTATYLASLPDYSWAPHALYFFCLQAIWQMPHFYSLGIVLCSCRSSNVFFLDFGLHACKCNPGALTVIFAMFLNPLADRQSIVNYDMRPRLQVPPRPKNSTL